MSLKIPPNLSSSEILIRTITAAPNRQKALIEALGKPGSKKRKLLPKSLRRKVHEEVTPGYIPKSKTRDLPLTANDIAFRESLRRADYRNSFASLENEKKALRLLDKSVKENFLSRAIGIRDVFTTLKQTFDHYGINMAEVLKDRYENLSFYNSGDECNEKVLYGKLLLYANNEFKPRGFDAEETEPLEVAKILEPLNEYEKRVFIETVLFDVRTEEEEVIPFTDALVAASKTCGDTRFKQETASAITSVGNSLLKQVIELAAFRIGSTYDYSLSNLKHYEAGVTTREINPEIEYLEGEDDEYFWEEHEYYEETRQEILLAAIEEDMLQPTQLEFEKIYEAGVYEGVRNRAASAMVKAAGTTLKTPEVENFLLQQAENVLTEPDSDIWRRMNVLEQYAKLKADDPTAVVRFLDHDDIYLTIAAYRSLIDKELFQGKGIDLLTSKIRKDTNSGNYKMLGITTLHCSTNDDKTRESTIELMDKVFALEDLNLDTAYKAMDGLNMPFNERGNIKNAEYSKSTYDFISSIGLELLSNWIIKPETIYQQ